jgi:hypothetical protein
MPVAVEVPMAIGPLASITTPESPVTLLLVNVSDANAREAPTVTETKKTDARNALIFFACCGLRCIER